MCRASRDTHGCQAVGSHAPTPARTPVRYRAPCRSTAAPVAGPGRGSASRAAALARTYRPSDGSRLQRVQLSSGGGSWYTRPSLVKAAAPGGQRAHTQGSVSHAACLPAAAIARSMRGRLHCCARGLVHLVPCWLPRPTCGGSGGGEARDGQVWQVFKGCDCWRRLHALVEQPAVHVGWPDRALGARNGAGPSVWRRVARLQARRLAAAARAAGGPRARWRGSGGAATTHQRAARPGAARRGQNAARPIPPTTRRSRARAAPCRSTQAPRERARRGTAPRPQLGARAPAGN